MKAVEILESEFLNVRARILEIGAAFDRLDRAEGDTKSENRRELLEQALRLIVDSDDPTRAEKIQILFSREYDPSWREAFGIASDGQTN